uniref:Uncharacterized protein n=1 Tax=Caenorhabditis japonica TaxID=281687 RepID=A0A8R1DZF4_CAEJA
MKQHHILLTASLVFAIFLWNVSCESDMYDDSSSVRTEEIEEQKICATNEVWMVCSSCEGKCGQRTQPCPRICQPARCQCPAHKGYRRDENGNCVFCSSGDPKL